MPNAPEHTEHPILHPGLLLTLKSDCPPDELRDKKLAVLAEQARAAFKATFEELSGRALGKIDVADPREPMLSLRVAQDVRFVLEEMRGHPILVHVFDLSPDDTDDERDDEEAAEPLQEALA